MEIEQAIGLCILWSYSQPLRRLSVVQTLISIKGDTF